MATSHLYIVDEGYISSVRVYCSGLGTTNTYSGTGTHDTSDISGTIRYTCTPLPGYRFDRWEYRIGSGTATKITSNSNPLTISASQSIHIKPYCVEIEPYKCYLYLTDNGEAVEGVSSVSVYSYTDGDTYTCSAGNNLTISDQTDLLRFTASVKTGYKFSHWEYRVDSGDATPQTDESNPFYYDGVGTARLYIKPRVQRSRPEDWEWWYTVSSNADVNLYADEWTDFCFRINEFRIYKGMGQYDFDPVTSGVTDISAYICNQAWTAINAISGHGTMPSMAVSDGDMYASFFTGLRDALNAIE